MILMYIILININILQFIFFFPVLILIYCRATVFFFPIDPFWLCETGCERAKTETAFGCVYIYCTILAMPFSSNFVFHIPIYHLWFFLGNYNLLKLCCQKGSSSHVVLPLMFSPFVCLWLSNTICMYVFYGRKNVGLLGLPL